MAERSDRERDRIAHHGSLIRRALHEFSTLSYAHASAKRAHSSRSAGHDGRRARYPAPPIHAPNAALLIDFDNVTMGIRSDLGKELRSLLSSEIIKGKVAVQRAYADWRRYPQYIVPLVRGVDRPDLRAGLRVVEEERDRHSPRDRRARARLHAPRDRHLHSALGRLRFLEPRHQAQGIRQVRHRRRHSRVVERSARPELRRVLQLQRARRSGESSPRTSRLASTIRGSSSPKPCSA